MSTLEWPGSRRPASRSRRPSESSRVPEGPVGQVSVLRARHLQQGPRRQPAGLPAVRPPLPDVGGRSAEGAVRRRGWTEHDCGPALDRSAEVHRHQAVPAAARRDHQGDRPQRRGHRRQRAARRHRAVVAAMEYSFIGGSMGVVVGEKITRADRAGARPRGAARHRVVLGRRAHDGGRALADADGEDQRRARPARPRPAALHLGAHRSRRPAA